MKKFLIMLFCALVTYTSIHCLSFGSSKKYQLAEYYALMYSITDPNEIQWLKVIEDNNPTATKYMLAQLNKSSTTLSPHFLNAAYRLAEKKRNTYLMGRIQGMK